MKSQSFKSFIADKTNSVGRDYMKTTIIRNGIAKSLGTSLLALTLAMAPASGAFAASPASIDNTATVTGTPPVGAPLSVDSNPVEVDLQNPTNTVSISKSATITTDGDSDGLGDASDVITYTYTIENTGNTTLTSVGVTDTHDGSTALTTPGFSSWTNQASSPTATGGDTAITLNPGAIAVFTTTYTITSADLAAAGGGTPDGDLDNSAVAVGTRTTSGDTVSAASTASIPLDITSSLDVAKAAYEGGLPPALGGTGTAAAADRPAGTTITYVYTITNDGNVPIANVSISDAHVAQGTLSGPTYNSLVNTSGNSVYTTGNTVDTLYPGDVAYFTATYVILQADIDAQ